MQPSNIKFYLLCTDNNVFDVDNKIFEYVKIKSKLFSIKEHFELYKVFKKYDIDIFYSHHFASPLLRTKKLKVINVIHDLIILRFNDLSKMGYIYYYMMNFITMKRSDKIIANSETTKKDIKYFFHRDDAKVVYHSYFKDKLKIINENILSKLNIKKNEYFLFVSSLKPHKNYKRIIESFKKFNVDKNFKLILVGQQYKNYRNDKNYLNDNNIIDTNYISDEEVNGLYKNATALLFISLMEGFGYPILEAQYHKCPVITSNISSMPEIAGKGAIFIDPYNIDSIEKAMNDVCNMKIREKIISNGIENLKRFSWRKYTEEVLQIFKELE